MTDAQLLAKVGEALYGQRWALDLSRKLHVNLRNVRRWAAGEYDIPQTVWAEIEGICRSRHDTLIGVIASIRNRGA